MNRTRIIPTILKIVPILILLLIIGSVSIATIVEAYPSADIGNDSPNTITPLTSSSGSSGSVGLSTSPSNIKIRAYGDKSNRVNIYKDGIGIGYVTGGAGAQTFTFPNGGTYKVEAVPGPGYKLDKFCNAANQCVTTNPIIGSIANTGNYLTYNGYFVKDSNPSVPYSAIFGDFVEVVQEIPYSYSFDLPVDANVFISMTGGLSIYDQTTQQQNPDQTVEMVITIDRPWGPDWSYAFKSGAFSITDIGPLKKGRHTVYLNVLHGSEYNVGIYSLSAAIMVNQNGQVSGAYHWG